MCKSKILPVYSKTWAVFFKFCCFYPQYLQVALVDVSGGFKSVFVGYRCTLSKTLYHELGKNILETQLTIPVISEKSLIEITLSNTDSSLPRLHQCYSAVEGRRNVTDEGKGACECVTVKYNECKSVSMVSEISGFSVMERRKQRKEERKEDRHMAEGKEGRRSVLDEGKKAACQYATVMYNVNKSVGMINDN